MRPAIRAPPASGFAPPTFPPTMNRYPLWKNILIGLVLLVALQMAVGLFIRPPEIYTVQ